MSLFGAVWKEENHDDGLVDLKTGKSHGFTIGIFAEYSPICMMNRIGQKVSRNVSVRLIVQTISSTRGAGHQPTRFPLPVRA